MDGGDDSIHEPENGDLLGELDTSLIEMFRRRQYSDIFADIPIDEHNRTLDSINELISSRNVDDFYERRREQENANRYFTFLWVFNMIPLPILNHRRIWREYVPNNFRVSLFKFITSFILTLFKVIRFTLFIIASSAYLHNILRNLFVFSNLITFSENFLRDIFTYIFKDNLDLLSAHEALIKNKGDVFYFETNDDYNEYSFLKVLRMVTYNWLSGLLNATCITFQEVDSKLVSTKCEIIDDTLIFRFSKVMKDFFPFIANSESSFSWSLTLSTVLVYLFYALGGDLICLNVLFFWSVNLGKRILHYKDVYTGVGSIVWNTLHRNII